MLATNDIKPMVGPVLRAVVGSPAKAPGSGGTPPPPFVPSLDFTDQRNSQYTPIVFTFQVG